MKTLIAALVGLNFSFFAYAGGSVQLNCSLEKVTKTEVVVIDNLKRKIRLDKKALSEADMKLLKTSTKAKPVKLEVTNAAFLPGQTIPGSR